MRAVDGTGNSLKSLKIRNRQLVLSFFRRTGVASVSDISRVAGLSKMTVHKIVAHYVKQGMVILAGKGGSTEDGGKKPNLFAFNPDCYCVFVVRLAGNCLTTDIVNLNGDPMAARRKMVFGDVKFNDVVDLICESFSAQLNDPAARARQLQPENFLAAVVGVDGVVDSEAGVCRVFHRHSGWGMDIPLCTLLRERFPAHMRIHVDNWWRYLGRGEMLYRGPEWKKGFYLIGCSGDRISGALVGPNGVSQGRSGFAGEIGHMIVDLAGGVECACGGVGCLEAVASSARLATLARERQAAHPESPVFRELRPEESPLAAIVEAAEAGDELGKELLTIAARHFAVAINAVIQTCDPGVVALCGDYARAGTFFLETLTGLVGNTALRGVDRKTQIVLVDTEEDKVLRGAAYLVADSLCAASI